MDCPISQPIGRSAFRLTCSRGNDFDVESGIPVLSSPDLRERAPLGQIFSGDNVVWEITVTNPSVFVLDFVSADGPSALLACCGSPHNCGHPYGTKLISLASASHFASPYVHSAQDPIFSAWHEDPSIWRDKHGQSHGHLNYLELEEVFGDGPKVGRHAHSKTWHRVWTFNRKTLAFNTTAHFMDETVVENNRTERPQLFFSEDREMTPLHYTNGVQERHLKTSYRLIRPLGSDTKLYAAALHFHQWGKEEVIWITENWEQTRYDLTGDWSDTCEVDCCLPRQRSTWIMTLTPHVGWEDEHQSISYISLLGSLERRNLKHCYLKSHHFRYTQMPSSPITKFWSIAVKPGKTAEDADFRQLWTEVLEFVGVASGNTSAAHQVWQDVWSPQALLMITGYPSKESNVQADKDYVANGFLGRMAEFIDHNSLKQLDVDVTTLPLGAEVLAIQTFPTKEALAEVEEERVLGLENRDIHAVAGRSEVSIEAVEIERGVPGQKIWMRIRGLDGKGTERSSSPGTLQSQYLKKIMG